MDYITKYTNKLRQAYPRASEQAIARFVRYEFCGLKLTEARHVAACAIVKNALGKPDRRVKWTGL
jgi:hypothetical protein